MEKPKKKEFKKPISLKEEKFIDEDEDNKKSIILIIVAIIAVLGLIFASVFLFNDKGKTDDDKIDVVVPDEKDDEEDVVEKVTSKTVAEVETYTVIYLDRNAGQIGETQEVVNLEDRVDEDAPSYPGYRFQEWIEYYDASSNIYYYVPIYRQNVERIDASEEPYLDEEDSNMEDSYQVAIVKAESPDGTVVTYNEDETFDVTEAEEDDVVVSPTYTVAVTGTVEELEADEIDEQVSIDSQYNHIIALRFNAPEGTTKESAANMAIKVYATSQNDSLGEEQYYYKGEDSSLSGTQLLDSTEEEMNNGEFYFYYYQEVDTNINSTVEVYWGNDPEADPAGTPVVNPKPEYKEIYNIDVSSVELESEQIAE